MPNRQRRVLRHQRSSTMYSAFSRSAVVNYRFPKSWPSDREQPAAIIGDSLKTEAPLV